VYRLDAAAGVSVTVALEADRPPIAHSDRLRAARSVLGVAMSALVVQVAAARSRFSGYSAGDRSRPIARQPQAETADAVAGLTASLQKPASAGGRLPARSAGFCDL
jgi:hypothetical protein